MFSVATRSCFSKKGPCGARVSSGETFWSAVTIPLTSSGVTCEKSWPVSAISTSGPAAHRPRQPTRLMVTSVRPASAVFSPRRRVMSWAWADMQLAASHTYADARAGPSWSSSVITRRRMGRAAAVAGGPGAHDAGVLALWLEREERVEGRDAVDAGVGDPERVAHVVERIGVQVAERLLGSVERLDQGRWAITQAAHPRLDDLPALVIARGGRFVILDGHGPPPIGQQAKCGRRRAGRSVHEIERTLWSTTTSIGNGGRHARGRTSRFWGPVRP